MTYVFKCPSCGRQEESQNRNPLWCACHKMSNPTAMRRDYAAEGFGVTGVVQLKFERENGTAQDLKKLVLPTKEYFAGPHDPEGEKGLRDWAEKSSPKSDNKHPVYPDMARKVF